MSVMKRMNWLGLAAAVLLAVPAPAVADDLDFRPRWSTEQKAAEIAFQIANVADGLQTIAIARNTDRYREVGEWRVITGSKPSVESAILAAALTGALHWAITETLVRADTNPWIVRAWQYGSIGLKLDVVMENHDKGLRLGWAVRY